MKCNSCGVYLEAGKNSVRFICPDCGKEIGRCGKCRDASTSYKCECSFEGP